MINKAHRLKYDTYEPKSFIYPRIVSPVHGLLQKPHAYHHESRRSYKRQRYGRLCKNDERIAVQKQQRANEVRFDKNAWWQPAEKTVIRTNSVTKAHVGAQSNAYALIY